MGVVNIRRSRIDITLDILSIAANGAKKTEIVYGANLNSNITNKYLDMLKQKDLIKQQDNIFMTTDKGRYYQEIARGLELK
ncbi:MAG: winged helix-turn-helix domain-containing protein [Methanohalobium sp.]|uniref:winged helix-turn-helix domain-containing protein n=1 Tax=Methanohalobium sp. TaxID=2837493 RepID=UPI00397834FC